MLKIKVEFRGRGEMMQKLESFERKRGDFMDAAEINVQLLRGIKRSI
jgi:hypothetical protein